VATLKGHTDYVLSVAFHQNGRFLATGSHDHTANLWRFEPDGSNANRVATLEGHKDIIDSVAFHPTELLLATGSIDGTVKLWSFDPNGSNTTCMATLAEDEKIVISSVAFHPNGRFLAAGSYNQTAQLWNCSLLRDRKQRETLNESDKHPGGGSISIRKHKRSNRKRSKRLMKKNSRKKRGTISKYRWFRNER
jgi:WD40 repeat protein